MKYGRITNEMGEVLDYSYQSGAENNHYVLIIGHGLDGNKDTPLILELSNKVSNEGMSVLRSGAHPRVLRGLIGRVRILIGRVRECRFCGLVRPPNA